MFDIAYCLVCEVCLGTSIDVEATMTVTMIYDGSGGHATELDVALFDATRDTDARSLSITQGDC